MSQVNSDQATVADTICDEAASDGNGTTAKQCAFCLGARGNLIELLPVGVLIVCQERIVFANSEAVNIFRARSAAYLIGQPVYPLVHPDYHDQVRERTNRVAAGEYAPVLLQKGVCLDGATIDIAVSAVPFKFEGKPARLVVIKDVTREVRAEEALRESEERFRRLAENAQDMVYRIQLKPQPTFEYVNKACLRITGYRPEDYYRDYNLWRRVVDPDYHHLLTYRKRPHEKVPEPAVVKLVREGGTETWVEVRNTLVCDGCGELVAIEGILRDVTKQVRRQRKLMHLATHDPLTNAANRRLLYKALKQAVRDSKSGKVSTLLVIDVDNFKSVNDAYGHDVGDRALMSLARLLEDELRAGELLARLGGDEFAALLRGVALDEGLRIGERLRRVVAESKVVINGHSIQFSLSVGVASTRSSRTARGLFGQADRAMYAAKAKGGNRVVAGGKERLAGQPAAEQCG